jgi:hypothetical protein
MELGVKEAREKIWNFFLINTLIKAVTTLGVDIRAMGDEDPARS